MESLRIDKTKLKTVKNYAGKIKVTVQAVYKMIKANRVKTTEVDGVVFIVED